MGSDRPPPALAALTDLLGLRPAGSEAPASRRAALGLVGSAERPRFLLPLGHPAATRAACTAYNRLRPTRTRITRRVVALGAGAGLVRRFVGTTYEADTGPDSLLAHLGGLLDVPDLQVAVGVGNHDEVWKPTLQCFDAAGRPVAYVKVGLGPVAEHLVATECAALEAWNQADDPRLVVPALLASTSWRDTPIICTEPMPADVTRLPPGPVSPWPVRLLDAPLPDSALGDSPWWRERTARHADDGEVAGFLSAVEHVHGDTVLSWARWHGDWVPWNLARSSRGLVAWDWEYSEPGAPVGLDEVHSTYQQERIVAGRSAVQALDSVRRTGADEWLSDVHLAMLLTRHALLRDLAGATVGDHHPLVAAADRRRRELRPVDRV